MLNQYNIDKENLISINIDYNKGDIRFSTDIERILKYSNVEENTANQIIGLLLS